ANDWTATHVEYVSPRFDMDGFVHCATAAQVMRVASTKFPGRADLILLVIDPALVHAKICYEGRKGETFPHIYGPINRTAIVEVEQLLIGPDGAFIAPRVVDGFKSNASEVV